MINENFSAILYLISSVFFILALKGLSSPETARRGNIFGILGMLTAVSTLILQPNTSNFIPVVICILLGGYWYNFRLKNKNDCNATTSGRIS